MTVGLIMFAVAIYAAQHGAYGIACLALLAMADGFPRLLQGGYRLGFVRLLRDPGSAPLRKRLVMNVNWTLFANLYNTLITPLIGQMQAMVGSVCSTMQPVALAMVTLWLGFVGIDIANGSRTLQQAMRDFFIAGMVIGALQTGQYTQYVSDFFLQAVPNTLGAALGWHDIAGRRAGHGSRFCRHRRR